MNIGLKRAVRMPFEATLRALPEALKSEGFGILTEIDIPNPEGALQPGTYVTVELLIPRKTPSLLVPAQGIIFNEHGMQVAVVKDGKANIQKINVTRDLGTQVEVDLGVEGDHHGGFARAVARREDAGRGAAPDDHPDLARDPVQSSNRPGVEIRFGSHVCCSAAPSSWGWKGFVRGPGLAPSSSSGWT